MNKSHPIPEDTGWLFTASSKNIEIPSILDALRADKVVLVRGTSSDDANFLIGKVAEQLGLRNQLDIQIAFASIEGHRSKVGKNFMTVNKRDNYQFIPTHSEGTPLMNMQLAALYCYENTTDGGESILMHTNSESPTWKQLRIRNKKIDLCGKKLSPAETAAAKMMHQISIPKSLLTEDDIILEELPSPIPGIKVYDTLSKITPTYSHLLKREVMVYWDNIASTDYDSAEEYFHLLQSSGLLKLPPDQVQIKDLDTEHLRRVWRSGMCYETLFHRKITHKMCSGDLIIQNNLTWTHSAANWTPGSGHRNIVAAFA